MIESLQLGPDKKSGPRIRRLNRVPILVGIGLVVAFFAVIVYGLSSRGLQFGGQRNDSSPIRPASSDADQLKQGIPDGIIGEPQPVIVQPIPPEPKEAAVNPFPSVETANAPPATRTTLESEEVWRARLKREQEEQLLRELHRQRMASLQADSAALDSPIAVELGNLSETEMGASLGPSSINAGAAQRTPSALDLYAATMQAGGQNADANGQAAKDRFFNQDIADLGYLPNAIVPQMSAFELKRGSVIPATLVTGINSDLPGRITAQVSQNVYDSATGRHLLVPQGAKLFGRYDSEVAFGQNRVLVIWTDVIFPNGSTLQIGGMAGTDAAGYGGFTDQVDNHYFETFGSAILVALIGAGTEMMIPQDRNSSGSGNNAQDAARRSFAETFGQVSEQTVSRNLNVQPTLEIRPGYQFNVLVDQDIIFPRAFQ
ncbi:IncP-type conjugal transfer protein TrbI [Devosia sp. LjRoot3]|uniref:IncP-type conjugal transfer protein TrbI n=1 Tax=Devosia sp. LjRoot3 TaxID=3342319 RepID=UPI003ECE7FF5